MFRVLYWGPCPSLEQDHTRAHRGEIAGHSPGIPLQARSCQGVLSESPETLQGRHYMNANGFIAAIVLIPGMLVSASLALGQTTGRLRGTVNDPSGGVVPKARVTAIRTNDANEIYS